MSGLDLTPYEPGESDPGPEIARLASLEPIAYDQERAAAAKVLGIRVSTLDAEVAKLRDPGESEGASFEEPDPWPEPIDAAAILNETVATIRRFCVLPDWSPEAIALWIAHAHAHDAAMISPILSVVSPAPRCGKSTVLSVVSALAPKTMLLVSISPAVLFRVVEHHKPTLLIDEGDTFLRDNEDLRGLLNGGHSRMTAHVWRCDGDDHEPRRFTVWAPKAIAMIGRPPETIEDRSVMVPLRRKAPGESVERFRADKLDQFTPLKQKLARLALDQRGRIDGADDPEVPEALNDRAQDNWRTLLAIADAAGGHWPETARNAAVALCAKAEADAEEAAPVLLLRDIRTVLEGRDTMASNDLLARLIEMDDAPWATWRNGKPISGKRISQMLKGFSVKPHRGNKGSSYWATDFADAWSRYLSSDPSQSATICQSATCHPSATRNPLKTNDGWQVADGGRFSEVADESATVCHRRVSI